MQKEKEELGPQLVSNFKYSVGCVLLASRGTQFFMVLGAEKCDLHSSLYDACALFYTNKLILCNLIESLPFSILNSAFE